MKMNKKKYLFKFLIATILFSLLANCTKQRVQQTGKREANLETKRTDEMNMQTNTETNEQPFACNLKSMNTDQRQRYDVLSKQLKVAIKEIKELPDGYAFRFPSDTPMLEDVAEWITYERLCCPFFTFAMEMEREGEAMWLRLTGREGVKPFIESEFGL